MHKRLLGISLLVSSVGIGSPALAQEAYRLPPKAIVDILDAPPTPSVSLSPDQTHMILMARENLPPLKEMAKPMERLAGMRLDPDTNARHGPRRYIGLSIKKLPDGRERTIKLPDDPNVGSPRWSPDGSMFAFTITGEHGVQLWVGDVESATARPLTGFNLNATLGGFSWMPDGERLLCRFVPENRGDRPERPRVPKGPVTQTTSGRTAPVRTYQDLLKDAHDEAMYDYLLTSQLAVVDAETGKRRDIGEPAVYASARVSPDGRFILVSKTVRPYSYLVPTWSFPSEIAVWDTDGKVVADIASLPLRDTTPIGGVPTGPRNISWQSNADATLVWTEALDGGDPKAEVPHRDRIVSLAAPFAGEPVEQFRLEDRASGVAWITDGQRAFVTEYDRDERWTRTWLADFARPGSAMQLVFNRDTQDRYADKGRPVTTTDSRGQSLVHVQDGTVFLSGSGSSPEGDRPFFDRMRLSTPFTTTRIWQSQGESYETVSGLFSDDGSSILTRYETKSTPPNYYIRDLAQNTRTAVTDFADPHPQLRSMHKELVKYTRADGVPLSATLYLPPDYQEGDRLPLLIWAYPTEFNNAKTAGQVRGSPYRFTRIGGSSHLFMLTQGYAIMDGASMPVVGSDPETVNDTFIDQIVASAQAAIDTAAAMGVADPDRVAVAGHSYGAFMTANLLAHCDLFRAGIARSGAYNRTLTPFGFQSERRTFWEAPDVYFNLSPFMHADEINEPLLLIHGQMDNNSGTFPIQSERLYHAVKGHGGTARLVMLPYESHGYRARESVMQTLAEMVDWLDQHVKYAPPRPESASADVPTGAGAGRDQR
jgi:dipeptidyl aminopeptidase/acylaminoacyl peptidase